LLVRAFAHYPDEFSEAIERYLRRQQDWASGAHHPWPLIRAYRALLLSTKGQQQVANEWAKRAV